MLEKSTYVKEIIEIIKCLSPQNQVYMLTLARVASVAENSVKNFSESDFQDSNKKNK